MINVELIAIVAGALLLVVVLVVAATLAIAKRLPNNQPRPATKQERARSQAQVEEWIARDKGTEHVRRMRGE